jgi:glycosyltransferase 2 family protein
VSPSLGERGDRPVGRQPPWLHVLGITVAVVAVAFCAREIAASWPSVRTSLRDAAVGWLAPAMTCAAVSMIVLALQWWSWLLALDIEAGPLDASTWYLGGELGKYLPGSVWTVLGRAELARRGGVARSVSYASTLLAYGTMCLSAGVMCGLAGAAMALRGGPAWGWAFLPLLVLAPAAVHPAVMRHVMAFGRRVTRGRFDAPTPSWPVMLRLVAWCLPAWLLLGLGSLSFTEMLNLNATPSRVVLAAVAAWTVGFLAFPVPAGAGVREVVFVAMCGLPAGPGAAVALLSRTSLLLVDAVLGTIGLVLATRRPLPPSPVTTTAANAGPTARIAP